MTKITDNLTDIAYIDTLTGLALNSKFISGLVCSNNSTDSAHDIDISTGVAIDSSGTYIMKLSTGLTKQIDAAWAVGTNAGGLFSGTVAADTIYYTFLIRKDSDGSLDAGFDTSATAANIPAGYTAYREIDRFRTDGSANIIGWIPTEFVGGSVRKRLKSKIAFLTTAATSTTLSTIAVPAPPGTVATVRIRLDQNGSATTTTVKEVDDTDTASSAANADAHVVTTNETSYNTIDILIDSSRNIEYVSNGTGGLLSLSLAGYTITRS